MSRPFDTIPNNFRLATVERTVRRMDIRQFLNIVIVMKDGREQFVRSLIRRGRHGHAGDRR